MGKSGNSTNWIDENKTSERFSFKCTYNYHVLVVRNQRTKQNQKLITKGKRKNKQNGLQQKERMGDGGGGGTSCMQCGASQCISIVTTKTENKTIPWTRYPACQYYVWRNWTFISYFSLFVCLPSILLLWNEWKNKQSALSHCKLLLLQQLAFFPQRW